MKKPLWTNSAWDAASSIIQEIKLHPFVQGLKDGTLAKIDFIHYLEQDLIYLNNYGIEMEMLSKLMPTPPMQALFQRIAAEGVASEKELHDFLSKQWNIQAAKQASIHTSGYMNFSRHYLETGDACLAIAALLPCFWVYNEIGHFIANMKNPLNNPYQAWIDTYESDEMDQVVQQVIDIANQLAADCSPQKQEEMRTIFIEAVQWEKRFFNQ